MDEVQFWDQGMVPTDIDNDGDVDLLLEAHTGPQTSRTIAWYENVDGRGSFSLAMEVDSEPKHIEAWPCEVQAADLDGDRDPDVIASFHSAEPYGALVVWYENTDGRGTFGPRIIVSAEGERTLGTYLDASGC